MQGQLSLLHVAVLVCAFVFVVSFLATFYATLLVITRIGALTNWAEERALSWGERAGRANSRFGSFLLDDAFRPLRRLYVAGWMATFASLGLGLLLLFMAERTG